MRSTFSKSLSLCHTMIGALPLDRGPIDCLSATCTSRSQFDPGNTTTAAFMRALLGWSGPRREQLSRSARSEEHTSELQSLMRISYAVFCLKKKKKKTKIQ